MTADEILEALLEIGTPAKLVVAIAQEFQRLETAAEMLSRVREQNRIRQQNQRSRNVTSRDVTRRHVTSHDTPPSPPPKEKSPTPPKEITPSPPPECSLRSHTSDREFDEFWKAFPRREGPNPKKPAKQKFFILLKSGIDPQNIIEGARRYASECRGRQEVGTRFIPQAQTWLNQARWDDRETSGDMFNGHTSSFYPKGYVPE